MDNQKANRSQSANQKPATRGQPDRTCGEPLGSERGAHQVKLLDVRVDVAQHGQLLRGQLRGEQSSCSSSSSSPTHPTSPAKAVARRRHLLHHGPWDLRDSGGEVMRGPGRQVERRECLLPNGRFPMFMACLHSQDLQDLPRSEFTAKLLWLKALYVRFNSHLFRAIV